MTSGSVLRLSKAAWSALALFGPRVIVRIELDSLRASVEPLMVNNREADKTGLWAVCIDMSKDDRIRPLLTLRETAAYLNVSVRTVRRHAADMGAEKIGGQLRFSMEALESYRKKRSLRGRGKVPRLK